MIDYSEFVASRIKPGAKVLADLTPEGANLLHLASALHGEGGEIFDQVKKHTIYVKPLDRENIIEELGDIEFYMEGIRQALGITREETIAGNIDKLSKRYAKNFSNAEAQERADKKE